MLKKTICAGISFMKNKYQNKEIPICSNCLHFIESKYQLHKELGMCKKFVDVNIVTGELKYELAKECRASTSKCEIYGSEYTDKNKP